VVIIKRFGKKVECCKLADVAGYTFFVFSDYQMLASFGRKRISILFSKFPAPY